MPKNIIITKNRLESLYCAKVGNRWKYTTIRVAKKLKICVNTLVKVLDENNIKTRGRGNIKSK